MSAAVDGGDDGGDTVIIECIDPNLTETSTENTSVSEITLSTDDIFTWDLSTILIHHILKIKANRTRLIKESSYFKSLLSGYFSESSKRYISIKWSIEMFVHILRFIHESDMEVTYHNFLPLYHAAIYFGLEKLILECKSWFCDNTSKAEIPSCQLHLNDLVSIWEFGFEHAIDWIVEQCTSYVAKNFILVVSCDAFLSLPWSFLVSCVDHPHLTVDSEWQLCEALLAWVSANVDPLEPWSTTEDVWSDNVNQSSITEKDWTNILEKIRVCLLPLWFTLGKSRCCFFSGIAKHGITETLNLLKKSPKDSSYVVDIKDSGHLKIRLTSYSKKLDLSRCPQITSVILLLPLLPKLSSLSPFLLETAQRTSFNIEHPEGFSRLPTLSFEAMREVDISKCSRLHLGAAIECFRKSFPFLRTIKMTHLLDFETKKLCQLIEKCTSVCEIDLTVDVSPLLPLTVSVLSSEFVTKRPSNTDIHMSSSLGARQSLSNVTKLTLEGRTDFSDYELHNIAAYCYSLCYLNIQGCVQVTDVGIANFIIRCKMLHSILATDTSFGESSTSAICSLKVDSTQSCTKVDDQNCLKASGIKLIMLHIGNCKGVSRTSVAEILSQGHMLKSVCLRDTCLDDHALYSLSSSSLEMLDVSNTMVSEAALSRTIAMNAGLIYLKAWGCKNLLQYHSKHEEGFAVSHYPLRKLYNMLGEKCKLEGLDIGWSFSFSSLNVVGPALWSLKTISVGLGGSLGPEGLIMLAAACPFLESVTLIFQVISDAVIVKLVETLRNLQALSICHCLGDISPLSLRHSMFKLRKLKLERVTPWMTNHDLSQLTKSCANLMELSLVGCTHLDVESQQIISSSWPGLISLHLEECGAVTKNGAEFLFDCKAMEDLLLRHNGPGIQRRFILDAALRLPMLRSLSLDRCDASEGDFDLPLFGDRYSLNNLKISRCKLHKCTLGFHGRNTMSQRRPVHKETLVLVWNSSSLQRVIIKERIT